MGDPFKVARRAARSTQTHPRIQLHGPWQTGGMNYPGSGQLHASAPAIEQRFTCKYIHVSECVLQWERHV